MEAAKAEAGTAAVVAAVPVAAAGSTAPGVAGETEGVALEAWAVVMAVVASQAELEAAWVARAATEVMAPAVEARRVRVEEVGTAVDSVEEAA